MAGLFIGWMDCIDVSLDCCILLDLDRIGWIGRIGSAGLDELDHNGWMSTHSFCKDGTEGTDEKDEMDGLDGSLVVLGWDGRSLVPAGTGAPEQERHHWLAGWLLETREKWDR